VRLLVLLAFAACATGTQPQAHAPGAAAAGDAGWLDRARQHIALREYRASPGGSGLQAPNRAHRLRTHFTPSGIEVHDRVARAELLRLELSALGRGAGLARVPAGELWSEAARVEIRRPGLVEWYENSPAGLEQGFTLAQRPPGEGPLVLELALEGASASLRGESLVLRTAAGRRLEYGHLAATDAGGRALEARLEIASAARVRIVVDDAGAAYPVVVDPLLTAAADAQLVAAQETMALGASVAGAGDVNGDGYADVIVGAWLYDGGTLDEGAAFVFHGSATGIADGDHTSAATVLESDQEIGAFGYSVAGAGDVNGDGYADVIVGAYGYTAGQLSEGAAFVFHGGATGIASGNPATADARIESDQALQSLGYSVAGAGDVNGDGYADVIVGSMEFGSAQIFHGSAAGIPSGTPATAATRLESSQYQDQFGQSVAGAGDVNGDGYADVIVGARGYDAGHTDEGAAFLFHGSSTGVADALATGAAARLEADQVGAHLGFSVAGAGDVNGDGYADVIVGATHFDAGEGYGEGAAFVFHGGPSGTGNGNPATAAAQLESDQYYGFMSACVAGAGDVNGDGYSDVLVGAPYYSGGESVEGAAFVFLGGASGVGDGNPASADVRLESNTSSGYLAPTADGAGDVNGDGYDDVVVGWPTAVTIYVDDGAVLVFHGGAFGIGDGDPTTASAQLESDEQTAMLGYSVAGAGDVNGDGFGDVIVGAPNYDTGVTLIDGAAFIFHGGETGIIGGGPGAAATHLSGDDAHLGFGHRVAGAGDVNGDGYDDVLVIGNTGDQSTVFVFHGSPGGIPDGGVAAAATRLLEDAQSEGIGEAAGAGDVNGDGYADVIVGSYFHDAGQTNEGAAFVFHGGPDGIADGSLADADARLESNQAFAVLGSVAGAGDVNGDGYADVIVGAWGYSAGQAREGGAFVFNGSASGIQGSDPASAAARIESDQENAYLGRSVAGAGDVNGDGYADVIVGARDYDTAYFSDGAAFVFHGSAAGIQGTHPASAATRLVGDDHDVWLGERVAGAGDVNGDGYADVIVGAIGYRVATYIRGAAFVFHGSAAGIEDSDPATAAAQLGSSQGEANFGEPVAGAGDVNADGYADVIVGAPFFDAPTDLEGAAFVFLGNRAGRPALARQLTPAGGPVATWGPSQSGAGFHVSLRAQHPDGPGLVRGEIEACPAGLDFGGAGCATALTPGWVAVGPGATDAGLVHIFSGLDFGSLYRWRARVLRAPATATQPGISAPPHPAHGPWRRVQAQAFEADVRVIPEPGLAGSLAGGALLLVALARARRTGRSRAVSTRSAASAGRFSRVA
jgi:hypothetical protein